jgi:TonB-like protein
MPWERTCSCTPVDAAPLITRRKSSISLRQALNPSILEPDDSIEVMSVRVITAWLAVIALFSTRGYAQPSCPNSGATVARSCELDQPLTQQGQHRPFYPDILRQTGFSGEVLLRYVVDTFGRSPVAGMAVLRSSHELFTAAVRNVMPRQRFEPPRRAGVLTSVEVEELVKFADPLPGWAFYDRDPVTSRIVDSTGRLLTTIYAFMPRDSVLAPVLSTADSLGIYDAVLDGLMSIGIVKDPPAAWCVQLNGQEPSADLLARWRRSGRPVVARADCPRTYTSMIYSPSSPKPPPGWVDPVAISADSLMSWAQETVILTTRTSQGTVSTTNHCAVARVAGTWKATCANKKWSIS